MKVLVLLCVALGAFLATVEAGRGGSLPTSPKPISCDSVLVKLNPSAYPHCCSPGPWRFVKQESGSKCPSGRRYVLSRTKCPGKNGIKTVCEPTIMQKADNLMGLFHLEKVVSGKNLTKSSSLLPLNHRSHAEGSTAKLRGKRALNHPCPTTLQERRVCADILNRGCQGPRGLRGPRGPRSPEDIDEENKILADLIQAQEDIYTNKRKKRGTLSSATRNVIFVLDSSASIGRSTYQRILNVLSDIASLLCGDVAVGMVTYATVIDLEFCPTCLRSLDEATYHTNIVNKIKSARYHAGSTKTGETVACLSEELLPSSACIISSKPIQLVFLVDGPSDGCIKVSDAIASLEARYPTIETYAIGMGNIDSSGVSDLLSTNFNANNIFNSNNIDELEALLTQIKALISGGQWTCAPVVPSR